MSGRKSKGALSYSESGSDNSAAAWVDRGRVGSRHTCLGIWIPTREERTQKFSSASETILPASECLKQHCMSEPLSGQIHLFFRGTGEGNSAVLVKLEGSGKAVAGFNRGVRAAKPACTDPQGNGFRRDFNDRVLWRVETMGGSIGAKQRSPGGPEFGVEGCADHHFFILSSRPEAKPKWRDLRVGLPR